MAERPQSTRYPASHHTRPCIASSNRSNAPAAVDGGQVVVEIAVLSAAGAVIGDAFPEPVTLQQPAGGRNAA